MKISSFCLSVQLIKPSDLSVIFNIYIYFGENLYFSTIKMKTMKEVLNSCTEFTFNDHYTIGRVVQSDRVRDCYINILSKCNHNDGNL